MLKDLLAKTLAENGIAEAVGAEITLKDGQKFMILTDEHPALTKDYEPEEIRSITPKTTGEGGVR